MKYLLLLLLFSCTKEQLPSSYNVVTTSFTGDNLKFFNELNNIRVNEGLNPLQGELNLTKGCEQHCVYMYSIDSLNHDYFWQRFLNSKAKHFGEVVAYGYYTTESQISAYESSFNHYQVLINPIYTHVGIANYKLYQTVDLASYK